MPYTIVKKHKSRRGRKTFWVRTHRRRTVGSLARGRTGKRFRRLSRQVTAGYVKKGYPKAEAKKIGQATAGKVFWRKFGKKRGKRILRRER